MATYFRLSTCTGNRLGIETSFALVFPIRVLPQFQDHAYDNSISPTYGIASSLDGLDGSAEAVGGDGEILDKVVEELPVLASVELLGLGVPDGGVGSSSHFE